MNTERSNFLTMNANRYVTNLIMSPAFVDNTELCRLIFTKCYTMFISTIVCSRELLTPVLSRFMCKTFYWFIVVYFPFAVIFPLVPYNDDFVSRTNSFWVHDVIFLCSVDSIVLGTDEQK